MALNIQLSTASSSSSGSTQSSGAKASDPDLFAQGMAAAAKSARQPTPHKAQQPKHAASAPKPATKPASAPKPKPTPKHETNGSESKPTAKSADAASKPKPAASPPETQNHDDPASTDASAEAANAQGANALKGRAPARATGKNAALQNTAAATKARDSATDPSAAQTNQSGLSLLQLLAQSLGNADSGATSTDTASTPATTDKLSSDATDKASDDPNAIALAMFSQALAAALTGQQTSGGNAAGKGDGTAAIGAATQSPGSAASIQDIMTVLSRDVAAGAQGKSDDAAAQFNVDPTKSAADGNSAINPTTVAPNALAHLGAASHFAAEHLRNDTNPAELRSPVGTSDWNEELGAHLTWMSQKGLETGSLRVSPEHLGPVEVHISVQNGAASVWFAANHADTRAALEQALPRLREMFASQGMNLADSGVSRQSLAEQGGRDRGRPGASQSVSGVSAVAGTDGASGSASRINLGLVDLYA